MDIERKRKYDREWIKEWRKKNPEKNRQKRKLERFKKRFKFSRKNHNKRKVYTWEEWQRVSESVRKWREKNPEKVKAHRIVYVAIRNGSLKKQSCWCGNPKSQAHHEDYSQPLKVIWLCRTHHGDAHKDLRFAENIGNLIEGMINSS